MTSELVTGSCKAFFVQRGCSRFWAEPCRLSAPAVECVHVYVDEEISTRFSRTLETIPRGAETLPPTRRQVEEFRAAGAHLPRVAGTFAVEHARRAVDLCFSLRRLPVAFYVRFAFDGCAFAGGELCQQALSRTRDGLAVHDGGSSPHTVMHGHGLVSGLVEVEEFALVVCGCAW